MKRNIFEILHAIKTAKAFYSDMPEKSDSGNLCADEEKLDIRVLTGNADYFSLIHSKGKVFDNCNLDREYVTHLFNLHKWRWDAKVSKDINDIYSMCGMVDMDEEIEVGGLLNEHAVLEIKHAGNRYFWRIKHRIYPAMHQVRQIEWQEISEQLFNAISDHEIKRRWST